MDPHLDSAPCVYLRFNYDGVIKAANSTVCNLLNFSKTELLQKNLNALGNAGTRIFFQTHFFPLLTGKGRAEEIYVVLRSKEGVNIPLLFNAQGPDEGGLYTGVGIVIINRNKYEESIIAAKRHAEDALRENKELQQAKQQLEANTSALNTQLLQLLQYNSSLNQLQTALAHTMKEPLRKISLFSSMLGSQDEPEQKKIIGKIIQTTARVQQLYASLQDYLQLGLDERRIQPLLLADIVAKAAAPYITAGHTITWQLQQNETVHGVAEEVVLLLQQLFGNAAQFSKKGGCAHVDITAEVVSRNSFSMLQNRYHYTTYLRITVNDDGLGFDAAYRDKIFGMFTKLQSDNSGAGMGLAICKRIMELHNGFIEAESEEGKGTKVHVFFPLADVAILEATTKLTAALNKNQPTQHASTK